VRKRVAIEPGDIPERARPGDLICAAYSLNVSGSWTALLSERGRLVAFRPGCGSTELATAEHELGIAFPDSLTTLLRSTNGFDDLESRHRCAWALETIVIENRRAWSDEPMLLDRDLLAFGDDGAGDWFCIGLAEDGSPIYHWTWIVQERRRIASDLRAFWQGWLDGSITV
jgi:SMI1-KNR4 cell-wall